MKAEYSVKLNGVWYRVGDELPDLTSSNVQEEAVEEAKVEAEVEAEVETEAESEVEIQDEPKEEVKYSKHKIMAMTVKQLRSLATEVGIKDADEYTGTELKGMLVEKLV